MYPALLSKNLKHNHPHILKLTEKTKRKIFLEKVFISNLVKISVINEIQRDFNNLRHI